MSLNDLKDLKLVKVLRKQPATCKAWLGSRFLATNYQLSTTMSSLSTDFIIVGAGAAGLFAACRAAAAGLRGVLVERRHRAGMKLLMCANNRCNFGHLGSAEELLSAYGEPVRSFLTPAIRALPSTAVARWFEANGLSVKRLGQRLYPASERGDDVLHLFLDLLRERQFPVLYNSPVQKILPLPDGGFCVQCPSVELTCRKLLLTVGGCSYPKTGSMGDGLLFAQDLGLETEAPRAGLAAIQCEEDDPLALARGESLELEEVLATAHGLPSPIAGNLVLGDGILRGSAIYDLTRVLARKGLPLEELTLDLLPGRSPEECKRRWEALGKRHGDTDETMALRLNGLGLPQRLAYAFAQYRDFPPEVLKEYPVRGATLRPLREAIVTVGGIARKEFNPETLECRKIPGLYAAGECLDVDGPTGGYNLEAAFATAALAVKSW